MPQVLDVNQVGRNLLEKIAPSARLNILLIGIVTLIEEQLNRVAAALNRSRSVKGERWKRFVALSARHGGGQSRKHLAGRVRQLGFPRLS
jgi:hypothetical protein